MFLEENYRGKTEGRDEIIKVKHAEDWSAWVANNELNWTTFIVNFWTQLVNDIQKITLQPTYTQTTVNAQVNLKLHGNKDITNITMIYSCSTMQQSVL